METIQIRRKVYTDVSFNSHGFEQMVKSAMPKISDTEAQLITKYVAEFFHKMSEFETKSEENLIKRNIVRQQLTYASVSSVDSHDNIVQSDEIIIGETRNWPPYVDVVIKGFKNKDFKFTNLDKPNDLLMSHRMAYMYLQSRLPKYNPRKIVTKYPSPTNKDKVISVPFDIQLMSEVVNIVRDIYGVVLQTKNYPAMCYQLKSIGLIDALSYALHGDKANLAKLVRAKLGQTSYSLMEKNESYTKLLKYSEFNLVRRLIAEEFDNPQKYLDMIHTKKLRTVDEFYKLISAKDRDKIIKLVGDRGKQVFNKACAHDEHLIKYMSLYKQATPWAISERDRARKHLMPFLEYDKDTKQYDCKSCGQRVICEHTFELAGKAHKDKIQIVENYREPDDSTKKYSYCKYCHEQIFRNELDEIMTSVKFDEIVRSRQQTMEGDTQAAAFENGLYFGVSNALSGLVFDYEFASRSFIKAIMNIIFNLVYNQVSKLKIENDLETYEQMSGLYGYIYTAIYMLRAFLEDPKINTHEKTPKNQSAYAKYFMTKITQRFNKIAPYETVKRLMYQAFVDLKDIGTISIQAKDESDKLLEILQHPLFIVLYKMYLCSNPTHGTLEAMKYIVQEPKPTVVTFLRNAKIPMANVSPRMKNLYTYLMDYQSPYCYIFTMTDKPSDAAKDLTYDPKLYNEFVEEEKVVFKQNFINSYVRLCKATSGKVFSISYGANYIYDEEGDVIVWSANLDWTTKSGKVIKLADIKKHVDESTPAKLEKRNQKIGFKIPKFKTHTLPIHKFIQLDNPPQYTFDQKIIGIVSKIDNKYSPYIMEYLGRSEGHDYNELIRGVIPSVENYSSGAIKVKYYCQLFIEQYYKFKNDPQSEFNVDIVDKSGIEFTKVVDEAAKFTPLNPKEYFAKTNSYLNLMEPDKYYFWQVESLAKFIVIAEKNGILGQLFVDKFIKFMINTEKKLSLPNPKKLAGGFIEDEVGESEYDDSAGVKHKKSGLDKLDYEQEEDDINDSDDR